MTVSVGSRVSAGGFEPGLHPVVAALRLAGQALLFPLQLLLRPAQKARGFDLCAVGEDREVRQPQVDTDLTGDLGQHLVPYGDPPHRWWRSAF